MENATVKEPVDHMPHKRSEKAVLLGETLIPAEAGL